MVRLFVTYMEQNTPPVGPALQPPTGIVGVAREHPTVEDYLDLYQAIGTPLQWDEHTRLPKGKLAAFLSNGSTAVYILRESGEAVGLCEFARLGNESVELKHFGLVPEVQGRGLGPYLLDSSLRAVWRHGPKRIWLHTDTNDHTKAKDTYLRNGFRTYIEKWEDFPD